jgi:RNA polymerase sigma-70 factor (ECF subfamily)
MKATARKELLLTSDRSEQLEYLMRQFGDKVLKLAYYYVRDLYQAEDIAQEVFCRVYEKLNDFRMESSYFTWIYRITINLCRDYLRSAYKRRIFPWGSLKAISLLSSNRMFEAVEGGEIFQKVMDLPIKYRTVIAMHYFEGFSTVEIAKILKISEGAVRTRLHRARNILKEKLRREDYVP